METYARELLGALLDDPQGARFTAFVNREAARDSAAPWTAMPSVVVPVDARQRAEWVRGEQTLLPGLAKHSGVDILHSLASTAPVWGAFRRVVTIHDLIYRIHPEAHARLRVWGMRVLVPLAARHSHRIIAPSICTRDDLVRLLAVPGGKIDVVPEGVGHSRVASEWSPAVTRSRLALDDRPVVLTVSAKRPHKNLGRLLQAMALIEKQRRPVLLLPGYETPWESELRRMASDLGLDDDTRFLGWIKTAQLEALYDVASCFVFPSLYEGFGLPVLEAMTRGLPVACSNRGSLKEVVGGAARLFDPEQPDEIARAIEALVNDRDMADRLTTEGRMQAARFRWSSTARATVASYGRALPTPGQ
jgi:glycosyltransferase involved in cell wall biosynthesis